jgi:predicted O-methyltransferase YrrM
MRAAKKLVKSVLRPWIRSRAHAQLARVRSIGLPTAGKIADAIDATLAGDFTPDERRWIERIEALRSELNRNNNPLPTGDTATTARTLEQVIPNPQPCTIAEACAASKSYFWTLLLFKLVRALRPTTAIELGTCLGISAAYQAAALELNGRGRIVTLEGSASRAAQSRRNLESLNLTNVTVVTGIFEDTLDSTLRDSAPIDYAFIDGHHDEHATLKYHEQFLPHLVDDAVVVFDDITWSPGMRRAWQTLQQHPNVAASIDLLNVGLCIVKKTPSPAKHRLRIRMPT